MCFMDSQDYVQVFVPRKQKLSHDDNRKECIRRPLLECKVSALLVRRGKGGIYKGHQIEKRQRLMDGKKVSLCF